MNLNRTHSRREKLRKTLKIDQVEAYLVCDPTNVRYLTGFTGEDSYLLLSPARALLVSDGRFTTQIEQECSGIDIDIRPVGEERTEAVRKVARSLRIKSLGFEATALSAADHLTLLESLSGIELNPVNGRVEALRAIKDRDEIAAIREAIGYAERAFLMLRNGMRRDESEKDVADTLEHFLRRCGASAASFPPIIAVGERSALPHARPTPETRIGDSDFVLIDWGATGKPYKSDLTRLLVTGKVTSKFEKVYRIVLAAQERGIAAIRPGVEASLVDAEARSVIEEAGFGRFFTHGIGHGIGMDIHEDPRLRKGAVNKLQAGMVVTVEPGIYLPDWGGVRIEDDVLVTTDGFEVLTSVPKSLDSLRVP